MKRVFVYVLVAMLVPDAHSQPETSRTEDYYKEITWGVNKNTNGGLLGGLVFKIAKNRKENEYNVYGLEIVNVKHPLEQRYLSYYSGSPFIWGKQNYLYSIRLQYGREYLIYKKAPQQGVQINGIVSGGPTIGVISPYYIIFNENYVPFDPEIHTNFYSIQGSGRRLRSLGEASLTAGLNAKAGLSFEFGSFKSSVIGLEVGLSAEAFPRKIILVPKQDNSAVFASMYINMFWGVRR